MGILLASLIILSLVALLFESVAALGASLVSVVTGRRPTRW